MEGKLQTSRETPTLSGGQWGRRLKKHFYRVPPCHPFVRATIPLKNYSIDCPFCERGVGACCGCKRRSANSLNASHWERQVTRVNPPTPT